MIHIVCHGNFTEYIGMNCWEVIEKEVGEKKTTFFLFYLFEKQNKCGNNQK